MRDGDGKRNGMGQFLSLVGCLYEKWNGIENGTDDFYPAFFMEKSWRDSFWQHNNKDLFFKNGTYKKCKQYTQKLSENCMKNIDLKFFR